MNEKEVFDVTAEVAKEIAKDVYEDVGHPVAKPTGELVGLIPRAIKAALSPLEKWILQKEYNVEETRKLLEKKLENVSPDQIEAPEPHIAVPAMQYISYCMDNEELREMYANLLACSMNKALKNGVHPAFVEIIRQICPDEAKIIKYLYQYNTIPIIGLKVFAGERVIGVINTGCSVIADIAGCEFPQNGKQYFDNLERLGLIRKAENTILLSQKSYDEIINHPSFQKIYASYMQSGTLPSSVYERRAYEVTSFCDSFFNVCIYDPTMEILGE